ncbi:MAG TPA: LytTR family DNA-binding domain-containing protein [Caulobacteraceae bacterium]|nr:LytTR family DNA-binding domain-containing protein [Caulobacteraceae bacterium]
MSSLTQPDACTPEPDPRALGIRTSSWRILAMCLAIAVVMVVSGTARSVWDAGAWLAEAMIGGLVGIAAGRWIVPVAWYRSRLWAAVLLIAVIVTVPIIATVLARIALLQHVRLTAPLVAEVAPQVFAATLMMTGLAFLLRRHPTQTHAAAADAPAPKFLTRLPARLAGADLYAVEAEDHYLRLHTSQGQDLILMRLSDAIEELEGLEGAQTHRSWWVARAAVAGAERLDGRAVLTLKDGAEVPVSRGFAKTLRSAGWF